VAHQGKDIGPGGILPSYISIPAYEKPTLSFRRTKAYFLAWQTTTGQESGLPTARKRNRMVRT